MAMRQFLKQNYSLTQWKVWFLLLAWELSLVLVEHPSYMTYGYTRDPIKSKLHPFIPNPLHSASSVCVLVACSLSKRHRIVIDRLVCVTVLAEFHLKWHNNQLWRLLVEQMLNERIQIFCFHLVIVSPSTPPPPSRMGLEKWTSIQYNFGVVSQGRWGNYQLSR